MAKILKCQSIEMEINFAHKNVLSHSMKMPSIKCPSSRIDKRCETFKEIT